ncbi:MAG: hypothetical protein GF344_06335 [Chitinivibrionales bacterium]|nr:hypothetical protein [Chitinivibrionales bacterium]
MEREPNGDLVPVDTTWPVDNVYPYQGCGDCSKYADDENKKTKIDCACKACEEETDEHCCKRKFLPNFERSECGLSGVDNREPKARVVKPQQNDAFSSGIQSIEIIVKATDFENDLAGIRVVTDGLDQEITPATAGKEYAVSWNTAGLLDGVYEIAVIAQDAIGQTDKETIRITIGSGGPGNSPPVVTLQAPSDVTESMTIGKQFTMKATVTDPDDDAISGAAFYMDGAKLANAAKAGGFYTYTWSVTGAVGDHTFRAKATDEHGRVGISDPVTVQFVVDEEGGPSLSGTNSVTINSFTNADGESLRESANSFDPVTDADAGLSMTVNKGDPDATLSRVRLKIKYDTEEPFLRDRYGDIATGPENDVIRTISLNAIDGQNSYSFTWDGKDGAESPAWLLAGEYTASVEAVLTKAGVDFPIVADTRFTVVSASQAIVNFSSIDRMVHAEIVIPQGVTSATVELKNATSVGVQTLGVSTNILSPTSVPAVYGKLSELYEDDNEAIWKGIANGAESYPDPNNLLIVKDDAYSETSNRKFHIYGIFDDHGDAVVLVEMGDGRTIEQRTTLTRHDDFNDLIAHTAWVIGTDITTLTVASASAPAAGESALSKARAPIVGPGRIDPFRYTEYYVRGLTTATLARVYNLVEQNKVAATTLNVGISGVKGFFNGVYAGASDDVAGIIEIGKVLASPWKRGKEYGAMLWWAVTDFSDFFGAMKDMMDKALLEFEGDARESVVWQIDGAPMELGLRAYLGSFAAGYVLEQAAVIAAGAGIVAKFGNALKAWVLVSRSSALAQGVAFALKTAGAVQQFKMKLWRFGTRPIQWTAKKTYEAIDGQLTQVRKAIAKLADESLPGMNRSIAEYLYDSHKKWADKLDEVGRMVRKNSDDWDLLEGVLRSAAKVERRLGLKLSDEAFEGWVKLYHRLGVKYPSKFKNLFGIGDAADDVFVDDFLKVFTRRDGSIHTAALDESLTKYLRGTDDKVFTIERFSEIHDGYVHRYLYGKDGVNFEEDHFAVSRIKETGRYPATPVDRRNNSPQVFLGPPTDGSPDVDRAALQILPEWSNMQYRVRFKSTEFDGGKLRLSLERKSSASKREVFESCTRAHTEEIALKIGVKNSGGVPQLEFIDEALVDALEKWDPVRGVWVEVPILWSMP